MTTVNPLFQNDALFDSEPSVGSGSGLVEPLFGEPAGPAVPAEKEKIEPLFSKDAEPNPLFVEKSKAQTKTEPLPLFSPGEASKTPVSPVKPEPTLLFDPKEPSKVTPVPRIENIGPAFEVVVDPLVTQTLNKIYESHPEKKAQERILKGFMSGLFPLDFDRISDFASKAIRNQQAVTSDAKRITDLHISLDVTATLDHIMQEAKGQHSVKTGFLQKLKSELESTLKSAEGAAQWYARLHNMRGSLKMVNMEIPTVITKGSEALEQLTDYALILQALVSCINDRSLNDATSRRLTLLLGAIQQVQISVKSLEQDQTLIRNQLQQIDEAMTITLPALGYTI